jgi:hypothetical protein
MAKFSMKQGGKEVGAASTYAAPHTSGGKALEEKDIGFSVEMPTRKNWTPLNGGVSIGNNDMVESTGIETRGNGAATKGRIARGPMA